MKNIITPDYLFEVSWEVCNKVGGIHTVVATKALSLVHDLKTIISLSDLTLSRMNQVILNLLKTRSCFIHGGDRLNRRA